VYVLILGFLLFAAGFFVLSVAAVVYVAYRFLALALSMDAAILREFKQRPVSAPPMSNVGQEFPNITGSQANPFAGKQPDTEGDFVPHSDEGAFIAEQVELIRQQQGLTEEDMEKFIRQAKGDMSAVEEEIS
jgi:hypothetical protein